MPKIDRGMLIKTSEYQFELKPSPDQFYVIEGTSGNGARIKHKLMEPHFSRAERMFVVENHSCGAKHIDLVIQTGPSQNADIIERNYYRVVFSQDLSSVVSEFFDPSVAVANAVLPLQTIGVIAKESTEIEISCKDNSPIVLSKEK
ncbi:hypothetical protein [Luteimonas sp. A537]